MMPAHCSLETAITAVDQHLAKDPRGLSTAVS